MIENTTRTTKRGRTHLVVEVVPKDGRSLVKVSGRIALGDKSRSYLRRIDFPAAFAGAVLKQSLEELGIQMTGQVITGTVAAEAKRLAHLSSPRLSDLVNRVNKYSNNFMAEQIAFAAGASQHGAPATWAKAQRAITQFAHEVVGWKPGTFQIGNASGLHDVNYFSTQQVVQLLAAMHRDPRLAPEYITSMSVAGKSGTLSGRMSATDAAGILRAKTGTLRIASALSGYTQAKDGEALVFSILINGYRTSIDEIWAAQDEMGQALAAANTRCSRDALVASKGYYQHP